MPLRGAENTSAVKSSELRFTEQSFYAGSSFYSDLGGAALFRHPLGFTQREERQGLWLSAGQAFPRSGGRIGKPGKKRAGKVNPVKHPTSLELISRKPCRMSSRRTQLSGLNRAFLGSVFRLPARKEQRAGLTATNPGNARCANPRAAFRLPPHCRRAGLRGKDRRCDQR